jgi:hypothetical protein
MKKILILICLLFAINFSLAVCENGCPGEGGACHYYGDIVAIGPSTYYCDIDSSVLVPQKTAGVCLNDYECVSGYSCLDEVCTNSYNYFIQGYNALLANISGMCYGEDYFCSNLSISNATALTSKNCTYAGSGFACYSCNSPFYYNSSLGKCITGMCGANPGCMANSSLNNASINSDYCVDSKNCFSCDSDFEWNASLNTCKMKLCTSSPGCINITNLTNGNEVRNRYCSSGSCFVCKSCYVWNANSSSCVYASNCNVGSVNWGDVYFSNGELSSGNYKILSIYDRVNFSFEGRSYWLGVLGIDSAKIVFKLDPIVSSYNLFVGSSGGFDLNGDGVSDVRVTVSSVSDSKANVSIKFLAVTDDPDHNNNPNNPTVLLDSNVNTGTNMDEPLNLGSSNIISSIFTKKNIWWLVIAGLVIIGLLVWLIMYLVKKPGNNSGNTNTQPAQQQPPVKPVGPYGSYPVGGYRPLPAQQNTQPNQAKRM